jgi:nucleoid DNA-binding protein
MKTTDLIEQVAAKTGLEKVQAKKAVEAVIAGIVDAAKNGDEINLLGFGKLR